MADVKTPVYALILILLLQPTASGAEEEAAAESAESTPRAMPCDQDPRHHELDFWLGEWEVFDADGRKVGINRIQRLLGGCLILENWESASGGAGKSVNYFDYSSGSWHQDWVDDSGRIIHYEGGLVDGVMTLVGSLTEKDGDPQDSRMTLTLTEEGRVLQVIEISPDGGQKWQIWFRGEYRIKGGGDRAP